MTESQICQCGVELCCCWSWELRQEIYISNEETLCIQDAVSCFGCSKNVYAAREHISNSKAKMLWSGAYIYIDKGFKKKKEIIWFTSHFVSLPNYRLAAERLLTLLHTYICLRIFPPMSFQEYSLQWVFSIILFISPEQLKF